jgi:pyruvate dehydrogenase (quinone)
MGLALPYGIAAKLAAPDRPVVALAGDGAMQMNGVAERITVAGQWRDWPDPRFVCVLHNQDLAEVTWELREMEGDPRFDAGQRPPAFPYARYADLLGLRGLRVDDPADVGRLGCRAGRRPSCGAGGRVDAEVPLLPPFPAGEQRVEQMRQGLAQDGPAGQRALRLLEEQARQEHELR